MSHWNHRVISEVSGDHTLYSITEVFYNDAGEPITWLEDYDLLSGWTDLEDLRRSALLAVNALERPVLRVIGNELKEV